MLFLGRHKVLCRPLDPIVSKYAIIMKMKMKWNEISLGRLFWSFSFCSFSGLFILVLISVPIFTNPKCCYVKQRQAKRNKKKQKQKRRPKPIFSFFIFIIMAYLLTIGSKGRHKTLCRPKNSTAFRNCAFFRILDH